MHKQLPYGVCMYFKEFSCTIMHACILSLLNAPPFLYNESVLETFSFAICKKSTASIALLCNRLISKFWPLCSEIVA